MAVAGYYNCAAAAGMFVIRRIMTVGDPLSLSLSLSLSLELELELDWTLDWRHGTFIMLLLSLNCPTYNKNSQQIGKLFKITDRFA